MSGLTISIDQNYPLSFEGYLFNQPEQVKNHLSQSHTFHLTNQTTSFARFVLYIDKEEGKSPYRAPFGSLEFDSNLQYDELEEFLECILIYCKTQHLKKLSIVSYPFCYHAVNSQMLTYLLVNKGFKIITSDLNFHLNVASTTFEEGLHESEKRRLKKCLKENFQVEQDNSADINEMFELIRRNREEKGFPLSMRAEELLTLFRKYPENYFIFTLRDRQKLIASSIGVKVNSKILYYFLPATDSEYKNFSPMVLVLKTMYDFCKENAYATLDLGIATAGGVANPGLIRFKEHLGALPSLKLSFVKEF